MEVGWTCDTHERQQMDILNGKSDTEKGSEKGREDGEMISNNDCGEHGLEKREIDNSGGMWRRARIYLQQWGEGGGGAQPCWRSSSILWTHWISGKLGSILRERGKILRQPIVLKYLISDVKHSHQRKFWL